MSQDSSPSSCLSACLPHLDSLCDLAEKSSQDPSDTALLSSYLDAHRLDPSAETRTTLQHLKEERCPSTFGRRPTSRYDPLLDLPSISNALGSKLSEILSMLLASGTRLLIYSPVGAQTRVSAGIAWILAESIEAALIEEDRRTDSPVNEAADSDSSSTSHMSKRTPAVMGMIGLHDMGRLQDEQARRGENNATPHGWIAWTADKIFLEKTSLYDLLLDLTPSHAASTSGRTSAPTLIVSSKSNHRIPLSNPLSLVKDALESIIPARPDNEDARSARPRQTIYCLADSHAQSCDDDRPSSSRTSNEDTCTSRGLIRPPQRSCLSRNNLPSKRSMSWITLVAGVSLSLLIFTSSVRALTDLGPPEVAESRPAGKDASSGKALGWLASTEPPSSEQNALLSALYRDDISIPQGCHRSRDLFGQQSSLNPWSAAFLQARPNDRIRGDLIFCPLSKSPDASPDQYKVYSVSGVVEMPDPAGSSSLLDAAPPGDTATWPQEGEQAEGFWRQRDGKVQWEPQSTEPLPLVAPNNASPVSKAEDIGKSPQSDVGSNSAAPPEEHAEAYDAWSAAIGGQSAEQWLGFNEWKDRHLAAEKERIEAERKAERELKKQAQKARQQQQQAREGGSHHNDSQAASNGTSVTGIDAGLPSSVGVHPSQELSASSRPSNSQGSPTSSSVADARETIVNKADSRPIAAEIDESLGKAAVPPLSGEEDTATAASPPSPAADASDPVVPAIRDPSSLLKTLKHRWNFASMDCAAVVHRTNPAAKFASSILSEKKDRYMLSACPDVAGGDRSGNFVIIELCDEISIDTIVLANYEFFSRMFKRFKVSVSESLKEGDPWFELGAFRARNIRGLQVFNATLPQDWKASTRFFRYVRVDFLEYYGNEFYCPLSLVRVYGLTQMDDYRREVEEERKAALEESAQSAIGDAEADMELGEEPDFALPEDMVKPSSEAGRLWDVVWNEQEKAFGSKARQKGESTAHDDASQAAVSSVSSTSAAQTHHTTAVATGSSASQRSVTAPQPRSSPVSSQDIIGQKTRSASAGTGVPTSTPVANDSNASTIASRNATTRSAKRTTGKMLSCPAPSLNLACVYSDGVCPAPVRAARDPQDRATARSSTSVDASSVKPAASPSAEQGRAHGHHTNGGAGGGTQSESIYRTITKRLNALEANATLSLQYIEASGQMLREVFKAMERRQETRLGDMLRALNSSNWRQIEALKRRQQVDLQQAIFEFDVHRQQTEAERRALLTEVHLLTKEVIFERRLGVVQLVLVLGLFVFMALTRGPSASPSVFQTGLAKLSSASPPGSMLIGRRRTQSEVKRRSEDGDLAPQGLATKSRARLSSTHADKPDPSTLIRPRSAARTEYRRAPGSFSRETTPRPMTADSMSNAAASDFAEMSDNELRSYLGFRSPAGARSMTPDPAFAYDDQDGPHSLHDETGDEGAETAIEDLEDSLAEGRDHAAINSLSSSSGDSLPRQSSDGPSTSSITVPASMVGQLRRTASAGIPLSIDTAGSTDVSKFTTDSSSGDEFSARLTTETSIRSGNRRSFHSSPTNSSTPVKSRNGTTLWPSSPQQASDSDASDEEGAGPGDSDASGSWQQVRSRRQASSHQQQYHHSSPVYARSQDIGAAGVKRASFSRKAPYASTLAPMNRSASASGPSSSAAPALSSRPSSSSGPLASLQRLSASSSSSSLPLKISTSTNNQDHGGPHVVINDYARHKRRSTHGSSSSPQAESTLARSLYRGGAGGETTSTPSSPLSKGNGSAWGRSVDGTKTR